MKKPMERFEEIYVQPRHIGETAAMIVIAEQLAEISAQLAKLNTHLEEIGQKTFIAEAPQLRME